MEKVSRDKPTSSIKATVMVVEDHPEQRQLIADALRMLGHAIIPVQNAVEALERLDQVAPDLIIADIGMPEINGLELLIALRATPETEAIPLMLLSARTAPEEIANALYMGADDYVCKPYSIIELQARVTARIQRPSVPYHWLHQDRHTGLPGNATFLELLRRELERGWGRKTITQLACVGISEQASLVQRFGKGVEAVIIKQMVALASYDSLPLETVGLSAEHDLLVLVPRASTEQMEARLQHFSQRIARHVFIFGDEQLRLTPVIGYLPVNTSAPAETWLTRAKTASLTAGSHLDLQPVTYDPAMDVIRQVQKPKPSTDARPSLWSRLLNRWRTQVQIALTIGVGLVLPYIVYAVLDQLHYDITPVMYIIVVIGLLFTSVLIWWEAWLALRRVDPPPVAPDSYPAASAIIAAYLPNEAATIEATIESFLRVDYPAPLQVILAYNSPRDMPIEAVFQEIAARDPRFVPFRVQGSTSKAQNVNAALSLVTGEFTGIFDADHHPDPDSFQRAWRWLANGYDVVQGHCLVRNGDASWVAKTVAVEFEAIYAVSHPGRARLHRFGIFGGSNGYWKTSLLRQTRMHGFMLTEDIDSSFRVIEGGHKIANDPYLISRELATTQLKALWNQRMRWAQGWFQVTLVQAPRLLRSGHLNWRQKLGVLHLLVWREIYPWLSWQMIPIIAYWAVKLGGLHRLDWRVPIFVLTSIFTLTTGPLQIFFIHRLADSSIRQHKRWFWWYLLLSAVLYVEYKNMISRVAQIKEMMGERVWKVTARS